MSGGSDLESNLRSLGLIHDNQIKELPDGPPPQRLVALSSDKILLGAQRSADFDPKRSVGGNPLVSETQVIIPVSMW